MSEACVSMIGAPWLCWAIQGTALLLIGLFLWRIVRRHQQGQGMRVGDFEPWNARFIPVPVRPNPKGPGAPRDRS